MKLLSMAKIPSSFRFSSHYIWVHRKNRENSRKNEFRGQFSNFVLYSWFFFYFRWKRTKIIRYEMNNDSKNFDGRMLKRNIMNIGNRASHSKNCLHLNDRCCCSGYNKKNLLVYSFRDMTHRALITTHCLPWRFSIAMEFYYFNIFIFSFMSVVLPNSTHKNNLPPQLFNKNALNKKTAQLFFIIQLNFVIYELRVSFRVTR